MRHFTLNPDKSIWNPHDNFFSSKDLHYMVEYFDKQYIPWIHHFILLDKQVYIKESRGKYKVIVNNFNSLKVPLSISYGYRAFETEDIKHAFRIFKMIVIEILDEVYEGYVLPF